MKYITSNSLIRSAVIFLATLVYCDAAVTFTFSEVGSDVVASATGSITATGIDGEVSDLPSDSILYIDNVALAHFDAPGYREGAFKAQFYGSNLTLAPSSSSGVSFGFYGNGFFFPLSVEPNTQFAPDTSFTWLDKNLEDIGLGSLNTTPRLVWEGIYGSDNNIFFVSTVPEPSSTGLLIGVSGLVYSLNRRKRKRA